MGMAFPKKVCNLFGVPVLIESNARPRRPSLAVSSSNSALTFSASSTPCPVTVVAPTLTVSK